jgi:hypothetical protein
MSSEEFSEPMRQFDGLTITLRTAWTRQGDEEVAVWVAEADDYRAHDGDSPRAALDNLGKSLEEGEP